MMTQMTTSRQARPDVLAIVARADLAESTRRKYTSALERFLDAGGDPLDAGSLAGYAEELTPSGRAQLKAVEYRTEALQTAIRARQPQGSKAHTWLTWVEVIALLDSCGENLQGRRDRLALGLPVAAGLRRAEAVGLAFVGRHPGTQHGRGYTILLRHFHG